MLAMNEVWINDYWNNSILIPKNLLEVSVLEYFSKEQNNKQRKFRTLFPYLVISFFFFV